MRLEAGIIPGCIFDLQPSTGVKRWCFSSKVVLMLAADAERVSFQLMIVMRSEWLDARHITIWRWVDGSGCEYNAKRYHRIDGAQG